MIRFIFRIFALGMMLSAIQGQAAVVAPDSAFETFFSRVTAPGKQTISFGSNGTPVVSPGVPSVATAGGLVQVTRTGSLALPAGARLPITATAKVSNLAVASLVKKALPLIPYLGTGVALYEFAKELSFTLRGISDGLVVTKTDPLICTVAPCYSYTVSTSMGGGPTYASGSSACGYYVGRNVPGQGYGWTALSSTFSAPNNCLINPSVSPSYYQAYALLTLKTVVPAPSADVPSSIESLADAIASSSGWPSGSSVSQAVVDAAQVTGQQIPTDQPSITGPASVAGPVSVSSTPYQDMVKKSTKASNYDCTYVQGATVIEGGSAICTERSVTTDELTKIDPATGTKTTTTTTSEDATKPADIPKDQEQASASDTPLPSQPTLYKRQYPDGLTGVWTAKKASLTSSPLIQLTTSLQPTISAPSGYPSWPIPFVIGSKNWGTFDVSPAPYIWDFLKVCTILGALFLARALIFGG